MIDICDGNIERKTKTALSAEARIHPRGNFCMCKQPTNPIGYADSLGISEIFRFILTHPDMDHMDGLSALLDAFKVWNFWHTGVKRDRPDFTGGGYSESDWDRYEKLVAKKEAGVTTLQKRAGDKFPFANKGKDGTGGGDGLYILAPSKELVADACSENGDINDSSYVILYRSLGGRVLLPGDAHDGTWDYVLAQHANDVADCSVMVAPHHGRDSDRSYDFLDTTRPKLTLFGCAPSEFLAYDKWRSRGLDYITSNQAGNIVLECDADVIHVYIENRDYAEACQLDCSIRNSQGYVLFKRIEAK
jgi:beta-lactamase superfamily II metal-dependent hydrolase